MGAFKIEIVGVGGHGCERKAQPGEKLYGRCGRFGCPDCMAYEFVQQLRQKGMLREGDVAYSVALGDVVGTGAFDAMTAKGLLTTPTFVASRPGEPDYFKITDPEFVPAGASSLGLSRYADGRVEAYAQYSMVAQFTHWPGDDKSRVVDDMLKNERASGSF